MDMAQENTRSKIRNEAIISRYAFVRAWSFSSSDEQGDMLFDLIGESMATRIRSIEEKQRVDAKRLDDLERKSEQLRNQKETAMKEIDDRFGYLRARMGLLIGGATVLAVLAGPVAAAIVTVFGS